MATCLVATALARHPFSGFEGGYTNFMAGDDERRVRENYGASYDRLAVVRRVWDPDNMFRLNQNVQPAPATAQIQGEEATAAV